MRRGAVRVTLQTAPSPLSCTVRASKPHHIVLRRLSMHPTASCCAPEETEGEQGVACGHYRSSGAIGARRESAASRTGITWYRSASLSCAEAPGTQTSSYLCEVSTTCSEENCSHELLSQLAV